MLGYGVAAAEPQRQGGCQRPAAHHAGAPRWMHGMRHRHAGRATDMKIAGRAHDRFGSTRYVLAVDSFIYLFIYLSGRFVAIRVVREITSLYSRENNHDICEFLFLPPLYCFHL